MVTIVLGAGLGVLIGNRLPDRTRATVMDALGLMTLIIGALNIVALTNTSFVEAVGSAGPIMIVLGALLIGGIAGSLVRVEDRLESFGGFLQNKLARKGDSSTFIEGFVDASLLFCIGPLAILGALSDGLGNGIEQLALKATLDGFAALAFASTLGWGVAASAISVAIVQGTVTILGVFLGSFLPEAYIASVTAVGGVLLLGVGLRLLNIKPVPVGDMLPSIIVAPLLTLGVVAVRS